MSRKLVLVVITSILLVSLHGSTAFARIISNDEFLDSYDVEVSNSTAYVSVPFYYQSNNYYCGPAALEMVLDYYGEDIPQTEIADVARTYPYVTYTDELRRAAHFSNLSTSLGDEMSGNITGYSAREVGYAAFEQHGLTIDDLKVSIDRGEPLIVLMWWTPLKEYGHYRVVVGYNETHIIMHDPWNKDLWGGTYGGANTTMTYSTFLDLWEYLGNWTLWVHPWDVELQIPSTVAKGDNLEVTANITYPCSTPFDASQYSAFSCNATVELQQGLELGPGETTQHSLGNITAGNSVQTSWSIHASETGFYNISVKAMGIIEGSVWAHGTYPPYDYEDVIGGLCVDSLSIINQTGKVHNLDTSLNYTSIQEAINAPETLDGHTIFVEEGIFYENVVVNKLLSLIGEDRNSTIIDGNSTGTVVNITASNVRITNFTIQKSRSAYPDCGIYLSSNGNNISYNFITDNYLGIWLEHSSSNTISGNNITENNACGIWLHLSSSNTISGNNITDNSDGINLEDSSNNNMTENKIIANNGYEFPAPWPNYGYGIKLYYSSNNFLRDNTLTGNDLNFGVLGSVLSDFVNDVDVSNLVDGKPMYYWVNAWGAEIPLDAGYVALVNCTNVNVENLTLTKNMQGILLVYTTHSTISENSVIDNLNGIMLFNSSSNIVHGNNLKAHYGFGIGLTICSNNTISKNNVTATEYFGIYLSKSPNNALSGNNITNNTYGILLEDSLNNSISGNNMANNFGGIALGHFSNTNTISSNSIKDNSYGVVLHNSSDNSIYRNNFLNNFLTQTITDSSMNFWDNGFEGNYWSNYNGTDADHDGIGDTEHVIDPDNTDHHPLMGMFSDFNATSEYHIQTVCNSSISDLVFNGTAMSFNVSGGNGTTGFCRICIPTALMNGTYRVFVNGTEVLPAPLPLPCSNNTHTYLYFTYNHSTQEVTITPELPSYLILPLFMISTILTVIIYRRKHVQQKKET